MLAVPVRRAGRSLGVLAVQNRNPRHYTDEEVDELETVAMLLAETAAGERRHRRRRRRASAPPCPASSPATPLTTASPSVPSCCTAPPRVPLQLLADDPDAELARLDAAVERMQRGLDELIASGVPEAAAARTPPRRARCWKPTAWSPPTPAGCAGSPR